MPRFPLIVAMATNCLCVPADGETVTRSVVVRHADLDLAQARDIARLDARIARAADEACGSPSPTDLSATNAQPRCVRGAIAVVRARRDQAVAVARQPSAPR